jgi:hypothetical protein
VEKLKGALLSEMPPLLAQLEKDLASFSKTTAYKTLWAQDKREMMSHRASLRDVAQAAADAEQIRAAVLAFSGYTGKLGAVNERAILREHDLALATACAARLEEAELVRLTDVGAAAEELVAILRDAWSLYGRDAEFDTYLRKVKKRGNMTFTAETLAEEMEQVQRLISRVPLALLE